MMLALVLSLAGAPLSPALYTPAEAVADVLSSPLEYVGRGPWFGMARWESCLYRNQRVLVVDVYCSRAWPEAFSVRVFSANRGRANFYLESETPATELDRDRYDPSSWKIEVEPPPSRDALPIRVHLDMSFDELRDYEEGRYQLYLPACYTAGGSARCHSDLSSAREAWAAATETFWKEPGQAWQQLIARMRALAEKHGT
jgi:hypothetical protein